MKNITEITSNIPEEVAQFILQLQVKLEEKEKYIFETAQLIFIKDQRIEHLQIKLTLALGQRYAARSEKLKDNKQLPLLLFNESAEDVTPCSEKKEETKEITIHAHTRKKSGRKPLPADLPRVRQEHDLAESEKICACGSMLTCIGEDLSEQLEIIPAQIYVIQHARKKYACKGCADTIKTAPVPLQAIPKSHAAPGLLSHILVSKFEDHLPLYRQEHILQRIGIDIPRATLCNWVIRCGELLSPLIKLMQADAQQYDIAYADETTLQVLKQANKKPTSTSYMWLFGGGSPEKFHWIYHYEPTRSGEVPLLFFEDFQGAIHVDGYAGYDGLEKNEKRKLLACFAHARRKFIEVVKTSGQKAGLADGALKQIGNLYKLEKEAKEKGLSAQEIKRLRQSQAKPLLEEFKNWLEKHKLNVPPKSPISTAIHYTLNQWDKLIRYIEDGRFDIDNNRTERKIKPFVIGRKNWLFNNSVQGAKAGAVIFSLIETCKEHAIDPYAYLRWALTYIPVCNTIESLEKMLPYHCDRALLSQQWQKIETRDIISEK